MIVPVATYERGQLAPLFRSCRHDRVLIDSVLEGSFGEAFTDSLSRPTVARLDSGSFSMLAGEAESPTARHLLEFALPRYVTPQDATWRRLLVDTFGRRVSVIEFTTYSARALDRTRLQSLEEAIPSGHSVVPLDATLAERCGAELGNEYFLEHFHSTADFLTRGLSYCVVASGRIVAAASSTSASLRAIDIEIETAEEHRCRGLGSAVGARLVRECLARDLEPCWFAANEESGRLARRLGFSRGETYETLAFHQAPTF